MVFIVDKDGKLRCEPCAKSPDIYRMTPYEYALTAEPINQVLACTRSLGIAGSAIPMTVKSGVQLPPASALGKADRVA